jgi:hypothetical protein
MDALASLAAAQTSVKAVLGLARGAVTATVDYQLKERLIEIQQAILDIQAKLGDAQAERLNLLGDLADLREKLRAAQAERAALEAYELHEVAPGQHLYKTKDGHPHEHYACPRCYSAGTIGLIQRNPWDGRTRWLCSSCQFVMFTGTANPRPKTQLRSSGWMGR